MTLFMFGWLQVVHILKKEGTLDKYPLFKSIHNIAFDGASAESMHESRWYSEFV
jgi:hypothetical protein